MSCLFAGTDHYCPPVVSREAAVCRASLHTPLLPLACLSPPLVRLSLPLTSSSLPLTSSSFLSRPLVCLSLPLVSLSLPLPPPLGQTVTSDSCPPLMTLLWQTASPGFYRPPLKASLDFPKSTHLASLCLSPCLSKPLINSPFYRPPVPKGFFAPSYVFSVTIVVQKYLGRSITFRWSLQHKCHINKT